MATVPGWCMVYPEDVAVASTLTSKRVRGCGFSWRLFRIEASGNTEQIDVPAATRLITDHERSTAERPKDCTPSSAPAGEHRGSVVAVGTT